MNLMEKIAGTTGTMLGGLQNLGVALMTNGFTMISLTTQRPLAIALTLATAIITILALIIYRVTTKKSHDSLNIQKTYCSKLQRLTYILSIYSKIMIYKGII